MMSVKSAVGLSLATALLLLCAAPVLAGFTAVEIPIKVAPGGQFDPHISGPFVVFTDTSSGDSDIWYYDGTNGTLHPVATGPGDQRHAKIAGSDIVYVDFASNDGDVFLFNITTGVTTQITNDPGVQTNPAVSDRLIAWEDCGPGSGCGPARDNIVIHDRLLGNNRLIGVGTTPAVSGPRVAYVDVASGNAIKVFDVDTEITSVVFAGPAVSPSLDGTNVALVDLSGATAVIAVYDVSGVRLALLVLPGVQLNPHISGDWVAFEDLSTGNSHVGLWRWRTGEVFYPAPTTSQQVLNDLSGTRLVYTDNRNSPDVFHPDLDIFAIDFTFTTDTADQITNLIALVRSFHLQPTGIETSLVGKLQNALAAVNAGDIGTACTLLSDFISEVRAQAGKKKLTTAQATELITQANNIKTALGCP